MLVIFYLQTSCRTKSPQLELSVYNYNLEEIKKDTVYHGYSIIKNTGNVPLIIRNIDGGCSCTHATCSKKTIYPSDTAMIRFSYRTFRKIGKQENYISIVTNTDSVVHLLKINAFIMP